MCIAIVCSKTNCQQTIDAVPKIRGYHYKCAVVKLKCAVIKRRLCSIKLSSLNIKTAFFEQYYACPKKLTIMKVGFLSRMQLHGDKCMHGRLCVKAQRTNTGLGPYYSKLEMSTFIGIETSLAGPGLAGPLRTFKVKQNFIFAKSK